MSVDQFLPLFLQIRISDFLQISISLKELVLRELHVGNINSSVHATK